MKRIMIAEDNAALSRELKIFLQSNGYECTCLERFDRITEDVTKESPDLLLLDLGLPGTDGHYVCRQLRKVSDIPIIIITSRNSEIDELMAFNFGADNFVTKPFNLQILLARISALLRRSDSSSDCISVCGFIFNTSKGTDWVSETL